MSNDRVISVIGLGYVGLPVAVAFSKKFKVIGFDISQKRIEELKSDIDRTKEIDTAELKTSNVLYTTNAADLKVANFHIIAVPTPINDAKQPDMSLVLNASKLVAPNLKKGDIVVYESTVYPGATEEDCVPVLEQFSNLKCGVDFKVGYSPERINPGDKEHTFTLIKKVVSGQDDESLNIIAETYGAVVTAGVYRAESIKVAEASKVIENTQRDINIAFMNELSIIFKKMNIDTNAVLRAAGTKWNFLKFYPGLVGGHCIGVDPFYLTYKAEMLGHHPEVILAGRRINDSMGKYVVQQTVEMMIQNDCVVKNSTVNLVGLTFKENCPDVRNSKVVDIYNELIRLGFKVNLCDPVANEEDIVHYFGQRPVAFEHLKPADVLIFAVSHNDLKFKIKEHFEKLVKKPEIFVDVKGVFSKAILTDKNAKYFGL
jgi:UDP-N-acetyl-D-galactosamine dehydrogenase